MSLSAGTLIWVSCRPLIRLAIGIACGFIITKADIFPPIAARGAGQIALKITLPCLLFSKIIAAFTTDNIRELGPLALVAVLYEVIGIVLAWLIKQFFWVPHRFRYGILVAGGWGNIGDLPTAVVLSITANAPFQGVADQNLAVAYISVFILVFIITLFPLGFHRLLAWDFVGPDVEDDIMRARTQARRQRLLHFLLLNKRQGELESSHEKALRVEEAIITPESHQPTPNVHFSPQDDATTVITSPTGESDHIPSKSLEEAFNPTADPTRTTHTPQQLSTRRTRLLYTHSCNFVKGLFSPVSVSIYIGLPIALVPQLKALFMDVPGVHMPAAPDGQPPLAFIQDTATFIGAASIPIGLICLGSSLAQLRVPLGQWGKLPVGAISWLAIGRIIIMPVLGVLICQGLVNAGVLSKDDKVLLFVCMFSSCLPTATTQVYLTQVYSGTGTAEDVAAFLIPQYILMFISMTALTAYAIHVIF